MRMGTARLEQSSRVVPDIEHGIGVTRKRGNCTHVRPADGPDHLLVRVAKQQDATERPFYVLLRLRRRDKQVVPIAPWTSFSPPY